MSTIARINFNRSELSMERLTGDYLYVRFVAEGLICEGKIFIHSDLQDLKSLFRFMAEHWQGWTGSRHFKSIEGDFSLTATHNGSSHVQISIDIKQNLFEGNSWSARFATEIEPGQLDSFAKSVATL